MNRLLLTESRQTYTQVLRFGIYRKPTGVLDIQYAATKHLLTKTSSVRLLNKIVRYKCRLWGHVDSFFSIAHRSFKHNGIQIIKCF